MLETKIKITKNMTGNEECKICNNDGYIVVDLQIYHCDLCEIGHIGNDDSTTMQKPVSENFDIEKLLSEDKIEESKGFFDKLKKLVKQ